MKKLSQFQQASKETLEEQGRKKKKVTEELIQRYSIYTWDNYLDPKTFNGGQTQRARGTGHDKGDSRKKHHEEERRLGRRDRRARKREREREDGA